MGHQRSLGYRFPRFAKMGRQYEKNIKEMHVMGTGTGGFAQASIDVNTNADLDWDQKREQARYAWWGQSLVRGVTKHAPAAQRIVPLWFD